MNIYETVTVTPAEEIITCDDCGAVVENDDSYKTAYGTTICQSCYESDYATCEECGNIVKGFDIVTIRGRNTLYVCQSCADSNYYHCDHCGEYVTDWYLWTSDRLTICNNCCIYYFICDECGEVYHRDEAHCMNDYMYCGDCEEENRPVINGYSYRPTAIFYGELSEDVKGYYGLEVEIDDGDSRNDAARHILSVGGDCLYLKDDGSLSSDGIEIVTHPCTLKYHMEEFPWYGVRNAAREYGYYSHDTDSCGLHIHASRTLFGDTPTEQDLNIAKCILLVDFFWEQYIVPFSRRNYYQLSDWAKKPNAKVLPSDLEGVVVSKVKEASRGDRYRAVNLQNRDTVEFRFFRGTLRRDTIIASIQWIDTLIKYVEKTPLADLWDTTWSDIFGNTQYSELKDYLQKRKLLDESEEL